MVVDRRCNLVMAAAERDEPNVHNSDILNRNETDQYRIQHKGQQSDQYLALIDEKSIHLNNHVHPCRPRNRTHGLVALVHNKSGVRGGT